MAQEEIPIRDLLHLCLGSEDQELWQEFVRRTQPLIANVTIRTIRRWHEPAPSLVDDLIQDTFVKLFANDRKALRSLKNEYENTIFGYLRVVAANVVHDRFRQLPNKVEEIELTDDVLPSSPNGMDRMEFKRLKDDIHERLKSLSSSETYQRDESIFWLYYEQGYTAKEISLLPAVGLSVKGVESTLQRLTRFLRGDGRASSVAEQDP
ncbi:MAG TPA: sigma-70 family RNA polymerase sigma factor [Candidatus Angelobacter sp.]|nr:sigma-70 family RNA polymerase sigma factor [Candidatus Angelobacter sp.]